MLTALCNPSEIGSILTPFGASLVAQTVKNLPAMQETWVLPLGQEDPLEKEMATYPFQLSCLGNPMDGGAWWVTIHEVARVGRDLATKSPPLPFCYYPWLCWVLVGAQGMFSL